MLQFVLIGMLVAGVAAVVVLTVALGLNICRAPRGAKPPRTGTGSGRQAPGSQGKGEKPGESDDSTHPMRTPSKGETAGGPNAHGML